MSQEPAGATSPPVPASDGVVVGAVSDADFTAADEPVAISGTNLRLQDTGVVVIEELVFAGELASWRPIRSAPTVGGRFTAPGLPRTQFLRFSAGGVRAVVPPLLSLDPAVVLGPAATAAAEILDRVLVIADCRSLLARGRFDVPALWELGALAASAVRRNKTATPDYGALAAALCTANVKAAAVLTDADLASRIARGVATVAAAAQGFVASGALFDARLAAKSGASGLGTLREALALVGEANGAIVDAELYDRLIAAFPPEERTAEKKAAVFTFVSALPADERAKQLDPTVDEAVLQQEAVEQLNAAPQMTPPPGGAPATLDPGQSPGPGPNLPPPPAASPSLRLDAPNGGETWIVGSKRALTWTKTGTVGNVKLEYQENAGGTWNLIAPDVSGVTHEWVVTGAGTAARVRVSEVGTTVSDVSDADFTLAASTLQITYPNGGESLTTGSTATVRWTSSNLTGTLKIQVSVDGGATYPTTLMTGVVNDGSQIVSLPASPSATTRIRLVSETATPARLSASAANFALASGGSGSEGLGPENHFIMFGRPIDPMRPRLATSGTGSIAVAFSDLEYPSLVTYQDGAWDTELHVHNAAQLSSELEVFPSFTSSSRLLLAWRRSDNIVVASTALAPYSIWPLSIEMISSAAQAAPGTPLLVTSGNGGFGGVYFKRDSSVDAIYGVATANSIFGTPGPIEAVPSPSVKSMPAVCGNPRSMSITRWLGAWTDGTSLMMKQYDTSWTNGNGMFEPGSTYSLVDCAMAANGTGIVVYAKLIAGTAKYYLVHYDRTLGWSTPMQIYNDMVARDQPGQFAVKISDNGSHVAAFLLNGGPPNTVWATHCVVTSQSNINCSAGKPAISALSATSPTASGFSYAISDQGDVLAVYRYTTYLPPVDYTQQIKGVYYDQSLDVWTSPFPVGEEWTTVTQQSNPSVGYDASLNKFVIAHMYNGYTVSEVVTRFYTPPP